LSSGTDGTDYLLLNTIVTTGGRKEERDLLIQVRLSGVITVGGVHIIDDVRFEIDDEDRPYDFSTERMNTLIRRAVDHYSLYRPYMVETTLSISEDVSLYSLPSDCMRLVELEYRTTEEVDDEVLNTQYPWLYEGWASPALTMIRNELIVRYDELGKGVWEEVNLTSARSSGRYVILYPPPDSDDTVDMRYVATHTRSGADYNTIPSTDAVLIQDLVVSYVLQRKATQISQGIVDYRAGQTRIVRNPETMRRVARERFQNVQRQLESNIVHRSRRGTP
jgi:hypothetical protein